MLFYLVFENLPKTTKPQEMPPAGWFLGLKVFPSNTFSHHPPTLFFVKNGGKIDVDNHAYFERYSEAIDHRFSLWSS